MMNAVVFVLGTIAGSAANAIIYRLPRDIGWWKGRSFCPKCKHSLSPWDLIPVISFLLLGGKCRYCHSPIAKRYLFVELFLGATFALTNFYELSTINYLLIWITTIIAVMDWETMLVSDWLVGIWAILMVFGIRYSVFNLYGLLIGIGLIGGIWLISKGRAMGSGDIGIAAVLGLWLGFPKILSGLWLAFVIGGIYGAYLLLTKKAKLKTAVPFGPFLIIGGWIAKFLATSPLLFPSP